MAKKYIDAEKIIAFLEKEKAENIIGGDYSDGVLDACDNTIAFISSLQQEQPNVDLDADIEMEWDSFNKHLAEYGEESEDVVWLNWNSFNELARHFYELNLKTRKNE